MLMYLLIILFGTMMFMALDALFKMTFGDRIDEAANIEYNSRIEPWF